MTDTDVKEAVRERYSQAARRVSEGRSCCGGNAALAGSNPITSNLYDMSEKGALPEAAVLASLGCGNPTALAQLAAGRDGARPRLRRRHRRAAVRAPGRAAGKAYGLDMTDEMLALARENQKKAGVENVEFLKGEIEAIPLPDNSVDVIISNCVINLSADKDKVLREAFRVLKPGGRFAVSDIVTRGAVPEDIRRNVLAWAGCIAGALEESEYAGKLANAGFEAIGIAPSRIYKGEDAREFLSGKGVDVDAMAGHIDGKFMSAFVRAVKPGSAKACCAPSCCG